MMNKIRALRMMEEQKQKGNYTLSEGAFFLNNNIIPSGECDYYINDKKVSKSEFEEYVSSCEFTATIDNKDKGDEKMSQANNINTNEVENIDDKVYLGAVHEAEDLKSNVISDLLSQNGCNGRDKIGCVWVINDSSMYYNMNNLWFKEAELNVLKKEEKEEDAEPYQFMYEPEVEDDEDEDLGYVSTITNAGETLTEEQIEALDGVEGSEFVENVYNEAFNKLAEESKAKSVVKEEIKEVDDLPTLSEIYEGVDEDDFFIESNVNEYFDEEDSYIGEHVDEMLNEIDDEDLDDDTEIWDDEFEDEDIETVADEEDLVSFLLVKETKELQEAVDDEVMKFLNDEEDTGVLYEDEETKELQEAVDDEVMEILNDEEDTGVPYYDEDGNEWNDEYNEDEDELEEVEETMIQRENRKRSEFAKKYVGELYSEGNYVEDEGYMEDKVYMDEESYMDDEEYESNGVYEEAFYIKDELNPELKLAVVKMSNKKHPSKVVKTSIDSANAVMNIDTPEVKGYTIEDLLSLTKYLVSKEIGPEDNRILEIVIEKLTEAQMWYDTQNK